MILVLIGMQFFIVNHAKQFSISVWFLLIWNCDFSTNSSNTIKSRWTTKIKWFWVESSPLWYSRQTRRWCSRNYQWWWSIFHASSCICHVGLRLLWGNIFVYWLSSRFVYKYWMGGNESGLKFHNIVMIGRLDFVQHQCLHLCLKYEVICWLWFWGKFCECLIYCCTSKILIVIFSFVLLPHLSFSSRINSAESRVPSLYGRPKRYQRFLNSIATPVQALR